MLPFLLLVSLFGSLYASRAQAYVAQGLAIAAAGVPLQGSGNYDIRNVQTGRTLSFFRSGGVTNLYPSMGGIPVAIQVNATTNGTTGTQLRISGGNGKCASAQWNVFTDGTGGRDWAMVAYVCVVGNNITANSSVENTKQWWYAVPHSTTLTPVANNGPTATTTVITATSTSLSSSRSSSSGVTTTAKVFNPTQAFPCPAATVASYYIIAQDHIGDMPAMALVPSSLNTSGGYISTALDYWNTTAPEQLWNFVLQ